VQVCNYSFQWIPHQLLRCSPVATGLEGCQWWCCHYLRWTWFKVGEASAGPTPLSRREEPHPAARQSRDGWRPSKDAEAAGEGHIPPSVLLRGHSPDFLSGFIPLAFDQSGPTCKAAGDWWWRGRQVPYKRKRARHCQNALMCKYVKLIQSQNVASAYTKWAMAKI